MIAVTRSLRRIAFAIGTLALACGQPAGAKTLAASLTKLTLATAEVRITTGPASDGTPSEQARPLWTSA